MKILLAQKKKMVNTCAEILGVDPLNKNVLDNFKRERKRNSIRLLNYYRYFGQYFRSDFFDCHIFNNTF